MSYQWWLNQQALAGETNSTLMIASASILDAGAYSVVLSNEAGSVTSDSASLYVVLPPTGGTLSLVTYNVKGNFAGDWSTNSAQIQAIGRQMIHLDPDIITFNEIPHGRTWEMTNFVAAYLPGYLFATNSTSDGAIRSVIVSRFPITRSESWMGRSSLANFGFEGVFTRDLFEAEIAVPGAAEPLHVFTTHLKSGTDSASLARRAAEASAISNFFVTIFLPENGNRPYLLTGDLNEDIERPHSGSQQPVQRMVNPQTGLRLLTPLNPQTQSELTFSIQSQGGLTRRYDYGLAGGLHLIMERHLPAGLLKIFGIKATLPWPMRYSRPILWTMIRCPGRDRVWPDIERW